MKTLKNLFALLVMGVLVLVSCEKKGPEIVEAEPSDFPEIMPILNEPAKDSVTIAIYVPQGTCNGAILAGSFNDYTVGDQTYKFKKIEGEDERWLVVTAPFAEDLAVKAIALTEAGVSDWGTQWGMNIEDKSIENIVILSGEGTLEEENGGEQKLTKIPAGGIVFVGIKEWKSAPCVERNKAGEATFTLTAVAPLPEGAKVGIVGKLSEELTWNIGSPVVMEQNGNTYTATYTVGDACEYKYFVSLDGGTTWDWNIGEDGGNRQMPLDLKPVDTVEAWVGLPAE